MFAHLQSHCLIPACLNLGIENLKTTWEAGAPTSRPARSGRVCVKELTIPLGLDRGIYSDCIAWDTGGLYQKGVTLVNIML